MTECGLTTYQAGLYTDAPANRLHVHWPVSTYGLIVRRLYLSLEQPYCARSQYAVRCGCGLARGSGGMVVLRLFLYASPDRQ